MKNNFDHEKLEVYKLSIKFAVLADEILTSVPKKLSVHDQLDRASTSIALNIAEGNGKFNPSDRCRFLAIARGSALECSACLDILLARGIVEAVIAQQAKKLLLRIVSMLIGLIRKISPDKIPGRKY